MESYKNDIDYVSDKIKFKVDITNTKDILDTIEVLSMKTIIVEDYLVRRYNFEKIVKEFAKLLDNTRINIFYK